MQINQIHLKVLLDLANQLQQDAIESHQRIQALEAENAMLRASVSSLQQAKEPPRNGQDSPAAVEQLGG